MINVALLVSILKDCEKRGTFDYPKDFLRKQYNNNNFTQTIGEARKSRKNEEIIKNVAINVFRLMVEIIENGGNHFNTKNDRRISWSHWEGFFSESELLYE